MLGNQKNSVIIRQAFAVACLAFCISGCGGKVKLRGERAAASGTVKLEGELVSAARIVFVGRDGEAAVEAAATVSEGRFQFAKETGPVVGLNRVLIYPETRELEGLEDPENFEPVIVPIPERYASGNLLTATVSATAEANRFEFELTDSP